MKVVAVTGDRFVRFGPYVPAVDGRGLVAFQAAVRTGGTGVFAGDRAYVGGGEVRSHPALDRLGRAWSYVDGRVLARDGEEVRRFGSLGPLGPTACGDRVALRADGRLYLWDQGLTAVAAGFDGFEGLPVVTADGSVVFRCATGIWRARGASVEPVATFDRFSELGRFPSASPSGVVGFAGTLRDGGAGVFVGERRVVDERDGFESFRGALVADEGPVVFFATPVGGRLGVYVEPEVRLTGLGDALLGSTVTDLALNPVSRAGQWLAMRVALADGREAIVRYSLVTSSSRKDGPADP